VANFVSADVSAKHLPTRFSAGRCPGMCKICTVRKSSGQMSHVSLRIQGQTAPMASKPSRNKSNMKVEANTSKAATDHKKSCKTCSKNSSHFSFRQHFLYIRSLHKTLCIIFVHHQLYLLKAVSIARSHVFRINKAKLLQPPMHA